MKRTGILSELLKVKHLVSNEVMTDTNHLFLIHSDKKHRVLQSLFLHSSWLLENFIGES